jgi:ubiquinone/menaquinone biosynthesis C-methylase UbiE
MTLTSIFRGRHFEPPPWLYAPMAQGPLMRLIYRLFVGDLAANLPPETRLLDVGTGPGYLLGYLARARPDLRLWGLDASYGMIRRARPRQAALAPQAPPRWVVADACLLPFPAGAFGQVVATFSFHIWPCPVAGLQELLRVLAPGGQAWAYELRREASLQDLQAFARETGLPLPLVYLGFQAVRRQHALPATDFAHLLRQAAGGPYKTLRPVHHLFWRAELRPA